MSIKIWGKYLNAAPEVIDTAENLKEAVRYLAEYRMAFGPNYSLWIGRRKDGDASANRVTSSGC
jgi:hypothetical protein